MTTKNLFMPSIFEHTEKGTRSWDLVSKLLEQRIVFLNGEVEEVGTNLIVMQLLYLESESDKDDIWMYINSPGGCVVSGTQVIDTMNLIKPKVKTLVTGYACSMGAVIASAGAKGHRHALENAQIMLHQISSGTHGNIQDMRASHAHSEKINKRLMTMLANNCGKKYEKLLTDTTHDLWLDSNEAIEYGVLDSVILKR